MSRRLCVRLSSLSLQRRRFDDDSWVGLDGQKRVRRKYGRWKSKVKGRERINKWE